MAECLELQLSEMELLLSMYPGEDEIKFDDHLALDTIRRYCNQQQKSASEDGEVLPSLAFTLTTKCCSEDGECPVQLQCRFSKAYPLQEAAEVHLSSGMFSRQSQRQVNEQLQAYSATLLGECTLLSLIQWIQENAGQYAQQALLNDETTAATAVDLGLEGGSCPFVRIWLYMHHIYSKHKRKDILDWSRELQLTGFCLPGKPGVVCVEGDAANVDEFWRRIRSMTWQRMTCRHREEMDGNVAELRHFPAVGEMNFDAHGGRHNHMDMGLFFQFLVKHQHSDMFELLFGVQGQSAKGP